MRDFFEDQAAEQFYSDLRDLTQRVIKFGVSDSAVFLPQLIASITAIYLLILDRANWKTDILTSLLIPFIFFSLPSLIFRIIRTDFGKWIAFIAIVLHLLFPRHFSDWLELPAVFILLIVAAPDFFTNTFIRNKVGVIICLIIACCLLQGNILAVCGIRIFLFIPCNLLRERENIGVAIGLVDAVGFGSLQVIVFKIILLVYHMLMPMLNVIVTKIYAE
ncbi:cold-regulated 413 plasma membrane protein 1-like isoform X4 [Glycine soja]|uniref:cold-regulated 413 plasma membrane protein 1-like isoform X4 n=1 Tax=Glycine soja TaxID=3848 RepID=UPI0002338AE4|nr:cold-regulated 413 plasma membrane protein 1-like isoform X4 [Glycine soja]